MDNPVLVNLGLRYASALSKQIDAEILPALDLIVTELEKIKEGFDAKKHEGKTR